MNCERIREDFKNNPKMKRLVDWLIMNQVQTRPRWYIRMLAPLYQHRGKHSVIHCSVRMDTPPYRYSLSQIHMVSNCDRAYDGIMEPNARMVADDNIANGIIDATE